MTLTIVLHRLPLLRGLEKAIQDLHNSPLEQLQDLDREKLPQKHLSSQSPSGMTRGLGCTPVFSVHAYQQGMRHEGRLRHKIPAWQPDRLEFSSSC